MAICRMCNREMTTACGCVKVSVVHHNKKYAPIKVGDPNDFYFGEGDGRCGDCGAKPGHYHHPGCDCERCPVCGNQLISCGCEDNANSFLIMGERPAIPPKTVNEAIQLAARNLSTINYIDTHKKYAGDIWYRFIRVPVDGGFAIYQITHVTKTYVNLSACSLTGMLPPQSGWSHADFKYDRVDPCWGRATRISRGKIEKLLKKQDEECLDWLQARKEVLGG